MTGRDGAGDALRPEDPSDVGPYLIERRIGRGGQATVYLGRDQAGGAVAVKVFDPQWMADPEARQQLVAEIEALKGVAGFGIARLLDAHPDTDPAYLVSEYVPGPDLAHAVRARGPLRDGELDRFALATLTALRSVHHAGLVHRDIKPSNVVLGPDGPRLVDFGIVARHGEVEDTSDGVLGTREYLAPELTAAAGHRVSPASDLFAWAATVAFAASGAVPTCSDDPLPGVPRALAEVLRRCLGSDPATRPDAAEAMELVLRAAHDSRTLPAAVPDPRPAVPDPRPAVPAWGTPPPPGPGTVASARPASSPRTTPPRTTLPPRQVPFVGRGSWRGWRWLVIPAAAALLVGLGGVNRDSDTPEGEPFDPAAAAEHAGDTDRDDARDVQDDRALTQPRVIPVQLFAAGIRTGFSVASDGSTVTAQEGCSLVTKDAASGRARVSTRIESENATCRLLPDPAVERVLVLSEVSRTHTRVRIDDLSSGARVTAVIAGTVQRLQFSADGQWLALGVDGHAVHLLDTRAGRLAGAGMPTAAAGAWGVWAADAGLDTIAAPLPDDEGLGVWSVTVDPRGEAIASMPNDATSLAFPLAVGPSGTRVARVGLDGDTVILSSLSANASATVMPWLLGSGPGGGPVALAFSPDGAYLAGFGRDGGQIWRVRDGTVVGPLLGAVAGVIHSSAPNVLDASAELRFSQDSSRLVLRSGRGVVVTWDVADATAVS